MPALVEAPLVPIEATTRLHSSATGVVVMMALFRLPKATAEQCQGKTSPVLGHSDDKQSRCRFHAIINYRIPSRP